MRNGLRKQVTGTKEGLLSLGEGKAKIMAGKKKRGYGTASGLLPRRRDVLGPSS